MTPAKPGELIHCPTIAGFAVLVAIDKGSLCKYKITYRRLCDSYFRSFKKPKNRSTELNYLPAKIEFGNFDGIKNTIKELEKYI